MYGYQNAIPPPWMWPPGQSATTRDPASEITGWIRSLEELKKALKEEKKEDKKKEQPVPSVFGIMLLMLLVSPVTGPGMYYFFRMSLNLLPTVH